jgi:SpoVK/Ycf46/Vps4 family AAA+-type ATPase
MDNRFEHLITTLFKARFSLLYISTWEEDRAMDTLKRVAADEAKIKTVRKVFVWSVTNGLQEGTAPGAEDSKAPLRALETVEQYPEPALFIFKDFHIYFGAYNRPPDPQVIRKVRDLAAKLKQSPKPKNIVFLCPCLVLPNDLQKDVTVVDFDLPGFEEIKSLLEEMIAVNTQRGKITAQLQPEELDRLAKAALGLTLEEAENAFARAMVEDGKVCPEDVAVILEEKQQIIKKTQILEFIESNLKMEDVGGLENLKRWLQKRNNSWLEAAQKYCLPAPKGVLLTGVPGCGKSLIAKSISSLWQLPLLRLDIGRIFSGLVGSSEENVRQAIRTAEAIAPAVLWVDEIEKGFSGTSSSGDSGTSARVFATFLTWMQEKTKPVFVIATANNIHLLPPELLRKGRFDEIFFVDLPTRRERRDIFAVHLKKRLKDPSVVGDFQINDDTLAPLVDKTEGFVGSEIEQAVIAGLFEAFSENRSIKLADFEKAINTTVSLSVTQAEQIRALREWANTRAVSATAQEDRAEYVAPVQPAPPKAGEGDKDVVASRGGRAVDF